VAARHVVTPPRLGRTPRPEIAGTLGLGAEGAGSAPNCERSRKWRFIWACPQGSALPPKFIHPPTAVDGASRRLVLIGKGVTFDSGGYNLKTGGSQIETDEVRHGRQWPPCSEPPRAIAELKPDGVEVHVIVAACENMNQWRRPSNRPATSCTASNGKTIEVNNNRCARPAHPGRLPRLRQRAPA